MRETHQGPQPRPSRQCPKSVEQLIAGVGNFLCAGDVTQDKLLRIADWQFEGAGTSSEFFCRTVLEFENQEKALVLDEQNGNRLARHYGCGNLEHWIGSLVRLSVVTTPGGPAIHVEAAADHLECDDLSDLELE